MKTNFRFLGLDAQDSWSRLVANQLKSLQSLASIASADVLLDRQPGDNPTFRVQVVLEVFGSDLRSESTDQTRQGALLKVTEDLERQLRAREFKRLEGRKGHPQPSQNPNRRTPI